MEFVKFSVNPHLFERFSNSILCSSQWEIKDLPGDIYRHFICPTAWSLCVVWKFKTFSWAMCWCKGHCHVWLWGVTDWIWHWGVSHFLTWLNSALQCFMLSRLTIFLDVSLIKPKACSTHCSRQFFIQCHHTRQYNLIAMCQYSCTRNVLWCQVHSSHIHSSQKTLNYNSK